MANEIVAKHAAEDNDDDDDDEEMTIYGLIPMLDAGIMDYLGTRPPSPRAISKVTPPSARPPRSRATSTTRTSQTRTTTNRTTTTTRRTRTRRRARRRRRRRRTTTTRKTTSNPGLVELSSQRLNNLHHGALLLYRNGTRGLLDDRDTATVSYATVCSVGCDELSSDAARAHR